MSEDIMSIIFMEHLVEASIAAQPEVRSLSDSMLQH